MDHGTTDDSDKGERMRAAWVLAGVAIAMAGCTNPDGTTNNTGTDSMFGGGAGAVVGGVVGSLLGHTTAATLAGAALGGMAGYFAGTLIGQQLDARDREAAARSTLAVLDEPVRTPEPGHSFYVSHPRARAWSSDHTTARGSTTLEKVSTTADGNECRLTRQLAVINGHEVTQYINYCQTASGGWKQTAA